MWRTVEDLIGVPAPALGQLPGRDSSQGNSIIWEEGRQKSRQRSWIPTFDNMPPIVQFVAHATQWLRAKCVPGAKQGSHLRLVGQLALGAKRHLSLVEVGGAQFLVGGGTENVTVIVPIAATHGLDAKDERNAGQESQ